MLKVIHPDLTKELQECIASGQVGAAQVAAHVEAGEATGWPPSMLQDDSNQLSKALAKDPSARLHAREAAQTNTVRQEIEAAMRDFETPIGNMTADQSLQLLRKRDRYSMATLPLNIRALLSTHDAELSDRDLVIDNLRKKLSLIAEGDFNKTLYKAGLEQEKELGAVLKDRVALAVALEAEREKVRQLREALKMAVRQNSHDMLMTGEEIRMGEAAITATQEQK